MSNIKNIFKERFEYIIGFVALAISLNGFKEELKAINVNLGFIHFNLAQYFLVVILACILSLHFYFIPLFINRIGWFVNFLNKSCAFISYAILFLLLISPFSLSLIYLINRIHFPQFTIGTLLMDVLKALVALVSFILVLISTGKGPSDKDIATRKAYEKQKKLKEYNWFLQSDL